MVDIVILYLWAVLGGGRCYVELVEVRERFSRYHGYRNMYNLLILIIISYCFNG